MTISITRAPPVVNDDTIMALRTAVIHLSQGRIDAAGAIAQRIVDERPHHFDALHLLGVIAAKRRQHAEAIELFSRALALKPDAAAYANRATARNLMKHYPKALADSEAALKYDPRFAPAHHARGVALKGLKRLSQAAACFQQATTLDAKHADAWMQRGNVALALNDQAAALGHYQRLLELQPNNADAWSNHGVALSMLRRHAEALRSYQRALELQPGLADAHANHAVALSELGRHREALAGFERALRFEPQNSTALANLGVCRLLNGDFAGGWASFESRWAVRAATIARSSHGRLLTPDNFGAPLWDGEPFDGTLLVWPEQGIGDQMLFGSVIDELRQRVPNVLFAIDPRLHALYARSFPGLAITTLEDARKAANYARQIPVVSLGRHFRLHESDFLKRRRAFLRADAQNSGAMRRKIAKQGELVCGISWHSKLSEFGADKSMPLAALGELFKLSGLRFVDLQYGDTRGERTALRAAGGPQLLHINGLDALRDLDRFAALVDACDVVVTVSNTTAHIAGALGKPTWVMLPQNTGRFWYWQAGREDSLWYPQMRLLRQSQAGKWADVVQRVRDELAARIPGDPDAAPRTAATRKKTAMQKTGCRPATKKSASTKNKK